MPPTVAPLPPPARPSLLAPFRIRSFRFQWPADLSTSWAFEMEVLILSWYILTETQSVTLLTLFAALQYIGTLIAPVFGLMGDRIGHRTLLCAMRAFYGAMSALLMALALTGTLKPAAVFVIATLTGMVRQSDLVLRNALIGETIPPQIFMGAMSLSRTTSDSARVVGALAGAALFSALGIGGAYAGVFALYAMSFVLTLNVGGSRPRPAPDSGAPRPSPWRDLLTATTYVWSTPLLLVAFLVALLVNFCAFPMSNGLLPYVASEVYGTDQHGLSYLVASWAGGALMGSIALMRLGHVLPPARMMIVFCGAWFLALLGFAHAPTLVSAILILGLAGFVQSLSLVPLAVLMLREAEPEVRGRVMGMRMLAVYSLPFGLLAAGPLIERLGFAATGTLYALLGLACTAWIALRWRDHLWRREDT